MHSRILTLLQTAKRILRRYGILLVGGSALVAVLVSAFTLGQRQAQLHEGGLLKTSTVSKQAAKLPNPATSTAGKVQSASVSSCADNGSGKLLLVSIAQQHIWACDGSSLVKDSAVTTGASALTNVDNATPIGSWHVYSKQANTTLKGCDVNGCWNDPVAYWMPFDDQVGFHDAAWQTFPFGGSEYTTQGSHGCVHLPLDFIAWVYTWAPIGTTVTVKA